MKKTPFLFLLIASFVGVLAALQVDHLLSRRAGSSGPDIQLGATSRMIPAAYETDQGAGIADFRAAAKRVLPSVVSVNQYQRISRIDPYTWDRQPAQLQETGQGSGVIISDKGYVVTNNHVVTDPRSGDVVDQVRVTLSDKRTVVAEVVGTDPRSDLAVLKINAPNLTAIELGDSSAIDIGQWVLAIGNPLGFNNTVSVGVVSSLNRSLSIQGHPLINGIQTDAAINPGNSGGALTDASGKLVGINSAIASPTRASVGIGFAIPVNHVKEVVNDIIKTGHAHYAAMGVVPNAEADGVLGDPSVRAQFAQQFGAAPPTRGVLVRDVGEGTPAAQAGIKRLDVLMAIDGHTLDDSLDMIQLLAQKKPGEKVTVKFWSAGNVKTATLTLQEVASQ